MDMSLLGLWKEGDRESELTCTSVWNVKLSKAHSAPLCSAIIYCEESGFAEAPAQSQNLGMKKQ